MDDRIASLPLMIIEGLLQDDFDDEHTEEVPTLSNPADDIDIPSSPSPADEPQVQAQSEALSPSMSYIMDSIRRVLVDWEQHGQAAFENDVEPRPPALGVGRVPANLLDDGARLHLRVLEDDIEENEERILSMLLLLIEDTPRGLPTTGRMTIRRSSPLRQNQPRSALLQIYKSLEDLESYAPLQILEDPVLVDSDFEPILQQFECPVCKCICFPPIMTCMRGHLICHGCKIRIFDRPLHLPTVASAKSCPTCRDSGEPDIRYNPVAGKIIGELEFKCLFHERGCAEILKGTAFTKHVKEICRFRPWKCCFCRAELTLETAEIHMMNDHNKWTSRTGNTGLGNKTQYQFSVVTPSKEITVTDLEPLPAIGFLGIVISSPEQNKSFVCLQVRSSQTSLAWIICLIGTAEEARKYRVNATLSTCYKMQTGGPPEVRTRVWSDIKVFSFQQGIKDIIEAAAMEYSDDEMPVCAYTGTEEDYQSTLTLQVNKENC